VTVELADALLKITEVAMALRKGRTTTYALIMSGQIPSVRIGGSRRVRRSDLDHYVAELPADDVA
jgi:excisionase family DNA binding protein